MLIPLGLSIAGLLSYAAFTDIYRQRIIYNWTSLALILLSWSAVPLLFANPGAHLAWGMIPVAISFFMYLAGGQGGGDLKLYFALGPLFGPVGFLYFLLSSLLIIGYSLPGAFRRGYQRDKPFGQRLGSTPAAPGIALAVPLTAALAGVPWLAALGLALTGLLFFALWRWNPGAEESPEQLRQADSWPQESLE
jgi:Flp pilus assembly protein protease CpaA